jgi:hypothetical protein
MGGIIRRICRWHNHEIVIFDPYNYLEMVIGISGNHLRIKYSPLESWGEDCYYCNDATAINLFENQRPFNILFDAIMESSDCPYEVTEILSLVDTFFEW